MTRSRRDLVAENALLRQQLIVLRRQVKRPKLTNDERIRGELLKLGVKVSKRTVQRYMPKRGRNAGQTWATFLKNHAVGIWACDFTVVHDLLFRPLYIFNIIELKTRRIVHSAVTRNPTDAWTAQQLREAIPWGSGPRYLICDRDKKYGSLFSAVARSTAIKELKTPIQDGHPRWPSPRVLSRSKSALIVLALETREAGCQTVAYGR